MGYLLDTDWIIQALAGRAPARTLLRRFSPNHLAISIITLGEVYEAAFSSSHPQAHLASFRQFLSPFRLFKLNDPIMERFAEMRALLRRRGKSSLTLISSWTQRPCTMI